VGDRFLITTNAPFTFLFPTFWQAHPDDVKNTAQGRDANRALILSADVKGSVVESFSFGGTTFHGWTVYEIQDPTTTEGLPIDGVIGYDFLRFYNVYFDYPERQIYLEPNDNFRRAESGH
jgi:hypothetical protein